MIKNQSSRLDIEIDVNTVVDQELSSECLNYAEFASEIFPLKEWFLV
jgi:hypothetical protein